jgi:hypothetical protein
MLNIVKHLYRFLELSTRRYLPRCFDKLSMRVFLRIIKK